MQALDDPALAAITDELGAAATAPKSRQCVLRALAAGREAAFRALGERAYDVQVYAALLLFDGKIAEMATGEGKTLSILLAAYAHVTQGRSVHVVLPNTYLCERDHTHAQAIMDMLSVDVGLNVPRQRPFEKRQAYSRPIVYSLFNDLAHDYLRDSLATNLSDQVQRDLDVVILDEVDAVLIDNARAPIVISTLKKPARQELRTVARIVGDLDDGLIDVDLALQSTSLTDAGIDQVEAALKQAGFLPVEQTLFSSEAMAIAHRVFQALRAHRLIERDKDYIVDCGHVVVVDRLTGRPMPTRKLPDGLHQAIEAKEGVEISDEIENIASMTLQNYFRLYREMSGTTATAQADEVEFRTLFGLKVVPVPRKLPSLRIDHPDRYYPTAATKWIAIVEAIKDAHAVARPVLVGTTSVESSEHIMRELERAGVPCRILNARQTQEEARLIAEAGAPGIVTIAANMAGRGTDIVPGGAECNAAARDTVIKAGGLLVIGTDRHECRRLDNQLRGRTGRQGDPGESVFMLSLEDRMLDPLRKKKPALFQRIQPNPKTGTITARAVHRLFDQMQSAIEGRHAASRKIMLNFDDIVHQQRVLIFRQRREILESDDLSPIIDGMREEVLNEITAKSMPAGSFSDQWDVETLADDVRQLLGLTLPISDWVREDGVAQEEIAARILLAAQVSDSEKVDFFGHEMSQNIRKQALIAELDESWSAHFSSLEFLRSVVLFRAYGKRDPVAEYMTEAFEQFEQMLAGLRRNIVRRWSQAQPFRPTKQVAAMSHILGSGED